MRGIELRRYAKFQVHIFKTDSGKNAWVGAGLSEDTPSILIHLPGAFAKTKKATNILRPAIDVSFWSRYEEFWSRP